MRKYGVDNFIVEQIEEIKNDMLDEREKYWIKYYDSYIKNGKGYNCTLGGEGNTTIDRDEVYKLWDKNYSIQEIAKELNHDRSVIRGILKNYENYSIDESNRRGDSIQANNRFKKVLQYDLNGKYLNSFKNMKDAERSTGVSSKNIFEAIRHLSQTAGGFQWRYEDDADIPIDISKKARIYKQKVCQIDKNNKKIINTYESASEASRITNISDISIRRACKNRGSAGGYCWEYLNLGGDL